MAQIGVEVTIEVLDRPILLRRLTTDRDWDQMVNFTGSSVDAYTRSFILDSRGSLNQVNHQDPEIDALWDQLKQASMPEEFSRLSQRGAALHRAQHGADERRDAPLHPGGAGLCQGVCVRARPEDSALRRPG